MATRAHAATALRNGPGHPLALVATLVLLLNDHLLKGLWPGLLTGKLSDVAWLIVAPVLVAAVLVRLRMPTGLASRLALLGVGLAFVLLQLWPPLGDTWVAIIGGQHTPDPTDLLTLPALALVPWCWRHPPRVRLAAPLAALACMATSYPADLRTPCPDEAGWDYNRPLALKWGHSGSAVPVDSPSFLDTLSLTDADGRRLDLAVHDAGGGLVLICPLGGLQPDSAYQWTVGRTFPDQITNQATVPSFEQPGTWDFRTASSTTWPVIAAAGDCRLDSSADYIVDCWPDTTTWDTGGEP